MTYLDNNIINVAIPAIQQDLHLTTSGLEWVVSSYILVFASLLLAGGRLADVWGRKRLFLIGLSIFTGASLVAGFAGTVDVLVISRAVQGLGAALVTPTTLAIISATFTEGRQRAAAVGIWSAVGALALAVGPLLGGLLSEYLSWGWIFFINVPVGLATLALAAVVIIASPGRTPGRAGSMSPASITSAVALFALTFALIEGHDRGWTSPLILASFARRRRPGHRLRPAGAAGRPSRWSRCALFRERVFTGGLIALMMWGFGLFGIYFFTSLYLQGVLGLLADRGRRRVRADGAADGRRCGDLRAGVASARRASGGRGGDAVDGRRDRVGQPARRRRRILVPEVTRPRRQQSSKWCSEFQNGRKSQKPTWISADVCTGRERDEEPK